MSEPAPDPFEKAVGYIREAKDKGRKIVPLFGAGISVSAGIPVTGQIVEHLAQLARYHRKEACQTWPSCRDFLLANGWPSLHQQTLDFLIKSEEPPKEKETGGEEETAVARAKRIGKEIKEEITRLNAAAIFSEVPKRPLVNRFVIKAMKQYTSLTETGGEFQRIGNYLEKVYEYRSLLNHLTGRDQSLTDAFFDRLVRGRRPASSHQFIAFLAQIMNWQLILTTNFDDLIETALREEGFGPQVYELTLNALPDAQLIKRHLSVVKLHGGAYNLRAGFDLDDDLSGETLAACRNYFPSGALLIVVGYGGNDRRVMSLIEAVTGGWDHHEGPKVIWVRREGQKTKDSKEKGGHTQNSSVENNPEDPQTQDPVDILNQRILMSSSPRNGKDDSPVLVVPYRDGRLFLQELYERLTGTHAPSRTRYRSIVQLPRTAEHIEEIPDSEKPCNAICFYAEQSGYGTSRHLARYVEKHEDEEGFHTIWVDLSEISSRATLAAMLLEEFGRFDRHLPPVTSPPFLKELLARGEVTKEERKPSPNELKSLVGVLVHCMRRGRYIIAFDSVGEFCRQHPADWFLKEKNAPWLSGKTWLRRTKGLYEFLEELVGKSRDYGISKVCIAATSPEEKGSPEEKAIYDRVASRWKQLIHNLGNTSKGDPPSEICQMIDVKTLGDGKQLDKPSDVDDCITKFRKKEFLKLAVLAVCCAFRRPRSYIGITKVVSQMLAGGSKTSPFSPVETERMRKAFEREVEKKTKVAGRFAAECDTVSHVLHELAQETKSTAGGEDNAALLCHQEGGFYWMHHECRDQAYQELILKPRRTKAACNLHEAIAEYYHDELFEGSRDVTAYLEFIFHLSLSAHSDDDGKVRKRLEWLMSSLAREKSTMLAYGRATTLYNHMRRLICLLEQMKTERKGLTKELDFELDHIQNLQAGILRNAAHYKACGAIRMRQVRLILAKQEPPIPGGPPKFRNDGAVMLKALALMESRKGDHLLLIQYIIEIAACMTGYLVVGSDPKAKKAYEILDKCKSAIEKTIGDLKRELKDTGVPDLAKRREIKTWIQVLLRCIYRMMDNQLRQIFPWDGDKVKGPEDWESKVKTLFVAAQPWMRESAAGRGGRLKCYIHSWYGRAAYLNHEFAKGRKHLELARAALSRSAGVKEHTALGVISLSHAEGALLESRLPTTKDKAKGELLDCAESYLVQAREHLLQGKRDNFWWPRCYILEARLQSERLKLKRPMEIGGIEHYFWDGCALKGLAACSAALSSIDVAVDKQRLKVVTDQHKLLKEGWKEAIGANDKGMNGGHGAPTVDEISKADARWKLLERRAGPRIDWNKLEELQKQPA